MNREEMQTKYGKREERGAWRKTDFLSALVVTFFGSGMLPKMPGTYGSLAAAAVAYPLALLSAKFWPLRYECWEHGTLKSFDAYGFFFLASLVVFFGAVPFVKKAMRDTGIEDPGWIVIDEVCGMWMALSLVSSESVVEHPWLLLVAFALFRFFDILKPLGIHRLERLPGAWGVMADDLLGGVYSGVILLLIVWVLGI